MASDFSWFLRLLDDATGMAEPEAIGITHPQW